MAVRHKLPPMPGSFHVHRSNRLERLVTALGDLLAEPVGTPLDPDVVVVQGRGMGIWLGGELSKRFGVWAAPVAYPRAFIEQVVRGVLGPEALGDPPLSEELLSWAVLAVLPELESRPEFAALRRYREGDTHGTRSVELAQRIATVFDHYLTYRPEWLRAWELGDFAAVPETDRWQAVLWQRVAAQVKRPHLASAVERLAQRLQGKDRPIGLPPRLLVFGLSTLPPLYVRVLALLSRHCAVHCFLFSPAQQAASKAETGHALVDSLGSLGRDFERVLGDELKAVKVKPVLCDLHEAPAGSSLLNQLQGDVYALAAPTAKKLSLHGTGTEKGTDATPEIAVHSCHGAMREVEVLHDQLLGLLTNPKYDIAPEQVIVLVPDLQSYAPLIEAVFARDIGDEQFIPYHVADQSERQQEAVIEGVLRVLKMVRGRVKSSEVLDLLLLEPIARRLGIAAADLERVREWVSASGVRWGIDGAHRVSLELPNSDANTWQFGLRRLLLGYAMPSGGERLFADVLGYDEIEGKEAQLLGVLAGFTRKLFGWLQSLTQPRSLTDWIVAVNDVCSDIFASDQHSAKQVARIGRLLDQQRASAAAAGFEHEVDVQVVTRLLEDELDAIAQDRGFFSGGVTFCALVPMRSIPFKVVCLLGMNDGDFPRSPQPLEIDLITKAERKPGDRSRRDDDRYLFLETLCAARERLIITYSGQSVRDNRRRPPSVCVTELLAYLASRCGVDPSSFVIEHKLQGFNPEYFQPQAPAALFSFATPYAEAANSTQLARQQQRVFFEGQLPAQPQSEIDIDELVRFFRSPAAFFLNRRLGLYLRQEEMLISDREPLELDVLGGWSLGARLLGHLLAGRSRDDALGLLRAEGTLPFGHSGTLQLERIEAVCAAIAHRVGVERGEAVQQALALDVSLDTGTRITGTIPNRWLGGMVVPTYSELKAKHALPVWLRHLASCAQGDALRAQLIGRGDKSLVNVMGWGVVPRDEARAILGELVAIYLRGQQQPLPFLPLTSDKYYCNFGEPEALERAAGEFDGDVTGEGQLEPHAARAFSGLLPPFDPEFDSGRRPLEKTEFHTLAFAVYHPMYEWQEQV